jgi:hypothetical protein
METDMKYLSFLSWTVFYSLLLLSIFKMIPQGSEALTGFALTLSFILGTISAAALHQQHNMPDSEEATKTATEKPDDQVQRH